MQYDPTSKKVEIGLKTELFIESILKSGKMDDLLTELGSMDYPRRFLDYDPISLTLNREYSPSKELSKLAIYMGIDGLLYYTRGYPIGIDIKTLSQSSFKFEIYKENNSEGVLFNENIKYLFFGSEEEKLIYIIDREKVLSIVKHDHNLGLFEYPPNKTICLINKPVNKSYGQPLGNNGLWLFCCEDVIKEAILYKIDLRTL